MEIAIIENKDYYSTIKKAWESDISITEKWHIKSGAGIENCVNDTVEVLNTDVDKSFLLYSVIKDEVNIGFFGVENNIINQSFLTTFFIFPEFREANKVEFWKTINKTIGSDFNTCIYEKNHRAIKWLKKNGATEEQKIKLPKGTGVILTFKKEILCQQEDY